MPEIGDTARRIARYGADGTFRKVGMTGTIDAIRKIAAGRGGGRIPPYRESGNGPP
ncbi:MAG: hypothetical protein AMXMBFR16_11600 [Candidatus Uhrbacteria bacterium]